MEKRGEEVIFLLLCVVAWSSPLTLRGARIRNRRVYRHHRYGRPAMRLLVFQVSIAALPRLGSLSAPRLASAQSA